MNDSSFTVTITFTNKFNLGRDDYPSRPMVSGQSYILQSGGWDNRPYRLDAAERVPTEK
jgi:hypothetical protein